MQNTISLSWIKGVNLLYSLVCAYFVIGMPSILLGQVSHSVSFSMSELRFTTVTVKDGNTYEKVSMRDLRQTDELGKPCLPVMYVKLIVPSDQDVEEVIIQKAEKQKISVTNLIYPAQPPIPTTYNYQEHDFVQPDSAVYESDNSYPPEIIKVVHDGYFDGVNHIVTLALYPLRYYPKSSRLVFISYVDFLLKMKPGSNSQTIFR